MALEPRRPGNWSDWRNTGPHTRTDPVEDKIGLGRNNSLVALLALWVAGIAFIAGVSLVASPRLTGIVGIAVVLGLLTTVRI